MRAIVMEKGLFTMFVHQPGGDLAPVTNGVHPTPYMGYLAHKKLLPPRTLQWAYA